MVLEALVALAVRVVLVDLVFQAAVVGPGLPQDWLSICPVISLVDLGVLVTLVVPPLILHPLVLLIHLILPRERNGEKLTLLNLIISPVVCVSSDVGFNGND